MSNQILPEAPKAAHNYPDAQAAFEAACALIPDDAPEIAEYKRWPVFCVGVLHLMIEGAPDMDESDGGEQPTRERMARNLMIEALETLNGNISIDEVRSLNVAIRKMRGESC